MIGNIQLCYRKVIGAGSTGAWEQLVFEDSYQEFKMQAQYYNQEKKYGSFAQLLQHAPGAEKLHFLVSASVTGYVQQLGGIMPDVLNVLGKRWLPFSGFRFEIINSDVRDKLKHQVAVNFFSPSVYWHQTIGDRLLVSLQPPAPDEAVQTEMFMLMPFVSICTLQQ